MVLVKFQEIFKHVRRACVCLDCTRPEDLHSNFTRLLVVAKRTVELFIQGICPSFRCWLSFRSSSSHFKHVRSFTSCNEFQFLCCNNPRCSFVTACRVTGVATKTPLPQVDHPPRSCSDAQTAKQSVFSPKSVKKSVKRGVRVLPSLPSLALCFQLRSRPFV